MTQIAERMNNLGTETAFEVLAKAQALERQGKKIVHLEIGEPDFDTPKNIREAAKKALDNGFTHYGPSGGLFDHRKAIAEYLTKTRGVPYVPEEIVVVPGAKPIIFFSILACVNPGDEVIYPNPGFPIYESMINFVGGKAVPQPILEEKEFCFDADALNELVTPETRMIIINSPANPTGGVLSRSDLKAVADIANDNDLWVMADEIYSEIIYDAKHESILQFEGMKERTILIDGYSKTFAMTGWRAGYGAMPTKIAPLVAKLMTNSNSCTATFTQIACIEALRGPRDDVTKMIAEFKKRRDVIVEGLNAIPGISCHKPKGAFYVFPNVKELCEKTGKKSQGISDMILYDAGVAVLPGTSFGAFGEGYLRLSYANSIPNIQEALTRIGNVVEKI